MAGGISTPPLGTLLDFSSETATAFLSSAECIMASHITTTTGALQLSLCVCARMRAPNLEPTASSIEALIQLNMLLTRCAWHAGGNADFGQIRCVQGSKIKGELVLNCSPTLE